MATDTDIAITAARRSYDEGVTDELIVPVCFEGRPGPTSSTAARTGARGGVCLVTPDHGNAERMLEDDGVSPHTAHTINPVPLIVTEKRLKLRDGGELSDLAPPLLPCSVLPSPYK